MHKFLANDFELERWKTAAIKNAYALLSKQRFGMFRRRGSVRSQNANDQNTPQRSSCSAGVPKTPSMCVFDSWTTGSLGLLSLGLSKVELTDLSSSGSWRILLCR